MPKVFTTQRPPLQNTEGNNRNIKIDDTCKTPGTMITNFNS